jgi:hypothetical protein
MERFFAEWPDEPRNSPYALGRKDAATELRRMAGEAQQPETQAFVCKCPAVLPATTDRADVLREPVNPCTRGNNFCGQHGYDCPPDEPAAGLPAPADRAAGPAALREAAAFYESVLHQSLDPDSDPRYCTAVRDVVMGLRHRADAAQQPTSDRCPHGCNVSTCPCLACEADQPAAVSQPDKEEA